MPTHSALPMHASSDHKIQPASLGLGQLLSSADATSLNYTSLCYFTPGSLLSRSDFLPFLWWEGKFTLDQQSATLPSCRPKQLSSGQISSSGTSISGALVRARARAGQWGAVLGLDNCLCCAAATSLSPCPLPWLQHGHNFKPRYSYMLAGTCVYTSGEAERVERTSGGAGATPKHLIPV